MIIAVFKIYFNLSLRCKKKKKKSCKNELFGFVSNKQSYHCYQVVFMCLYGVNGN